MSAQLEVTQQAHQKLSELVEEHPDALAVRVIEHDDKCNGPSLMIRLDAPAAGDATVEHDGVTYVIEIDLAAKLGSVTVDFVQRGLKGGFEIRSENLPELASGRQGGGSL